MPEANVPANLLGGDLVLSATPGWLGTAAIACAIIAAVIVMRRYRPAPPGLSGIIAKPVVVLLSRWLSCY